MDSQETWEYQRDQAWALATHLVADGLTDPVVILDRIEAETLGADFSPWASQEFVRRIEGLVA